MAAGTGVGITYKTFKERGSTPSTPTATYHRLYYKEDGKLYTINSAGYEEMVGSSVNLDYQNSVKAIATATSVPPTEVAGDRYLISATGTPHANWDGALNNDIVEFDGIVWIATHPTEGMYTEVEALDTIYIYLTSWAAWQNQATTTTSSVTFANLTLGDSGIMTWDNAPAANNGFSGDVESVTAGETVALSNVLYEKSDGEWYLADADASSTMPAMRMAVGAGTDGNAVSTITRGVVRYDSWTWTVGAPIYVSTTGTTTNTLTQTAPSGDGDQIQIVGYALSATVMYFNPSPVVVEIGLDIVDLGTATPSTITFAEMTAIPKTWMANHSSDQTITFAAPVAADVGKRFTIVKNGTGAGKLILDAPADVYLHSASFSSAASGTAYLAASAYGSMTWLVTSATTLQLLTADGSVTFT
jgi:hypothetical protein